MNNQAEVTAAMQGVDDVMREMWESIKHNDTKIDSERVEATYVVDVVQAHGRLVEALKNLRAAYRFYGMEAPQPYGTGHDCTLTPLEQQHTSND